MRLLCFGNILIIIHRIIALEDEAKHMSMWQQKSDILFFNLILQARKVVLLLCPFAFSKQNDYKNLLDFISIWTVTKAKAEYGIVVLRFNWYWPTEYVLILIYLIANLIIQQLAHDSQFREWKFRHFSYFNTGQL